MRAGVLLILLVAFSFLFTLKDQPTHRIPSLQASIRVAGKHRAKKFWKRKAFRSRRFGDRKRRH